MAAHAEDALGRACIPQVLDFPFTIPATKTARTEGLVASQYREVFNLVAACVAAICAIVANQGSVAQEEEVGIGIEERAAGIASGLSTC